MALWRRTDNQPAADVAALQARLSQLESRVRDLEQQEVELAEMRRTAANAIRSLTRAALNAAEKPEPAPVRGNGEAPPRETVLDQLRRSRHALPHRS